MYCIYNRIEYSHLHSTCICIYIMRVLMSNDLPQMGLEPMYMYIHVHIIIRVLCISTPLIVFPPSFKLFYLIVNRKCCFLLDVLCILHVHLSLYITPILLYMYTHIHVHTHTCTHTYTYICTSEMACAWRCQGASVACTCTCILVCRLY